MTYSARIAIGANLSGTCGSVHGKLRQSVRCLGASGNLSIISVSGLYDTSPVGSLGRTPRYLNAVIVVQSNLPPTRLLRFLKVLEREAGRRRGGAFGPRPLDLDIIDLGSRCIGWPTKPRDRSWSNARSAMLARRKRRGWLMLPHPEMHLRRFVLEPLAEVAPHWHHPVLGVSVRRLLARLPRHPGQIRRVLDSQWLSCDTEACKV